MNAQVYDQYKRSSVETVSPGKLLLMLYDGALKNINNATLAIKDNNINQAHNDIVKTQDIIVELMSTLDMSYDISKSLFSLYDYIMNRLIEANINKDAVILAEVGAFVGELRDIWQEAVKKQGNAHMARTVNNVASFSLEG